MPLFVEYNDITRETNRVFFSEKKPSDVMYMSYIEIPPSMSEVNLDTNVDKLIESINKNSDINNIQEAKKEPVDEQILQIIEEV